MDVAFFSVNLGDLWKRVPAEILGRIRLPGGNLTWAYVLAERGAIIWTAFLIMQFSQGVPH